MKKAWIAIAALPMLALAGCGAAASTVNQTTSTTSSDQNTIQNTSTSSTPSLKQQEIDLTVLPGGKLGPDGKMHDVITNGNFTVLQGVPVKLTVYNYDGGKHTITNTSLGLNLQASPSAKKGVPGVTTVAFTPQTAGDFTWQCLDPCDGENSDWSMAHNGYMQGTIHVVPQSNNVQHIYLTIKDGLEYASADGKLHDVYSPAGFTVQAGIPVQVTVENFDSGEHSFTAPDLGLNQMFKGAAKEGQPSESTFTFTPNKAGQFRWQCIVQCDGNGWAMTHDGYMAGTVTVTN